MKSNFYLLLSIFLMLVSVPAFAQIGIGTKTPAPSAALEVTSSTNNKGILIPRITATQKDAIASPAQGLLVYQTTAPIGFYYYTGNSWKLMAIQTDLAGKVDKVDGKDLSTNDYTTAEKIKLAAITGTNTGDQTTITGNAGTATKLAASKTINGVAFDGTTDISIAAAASAEQLTGTTIKSTVTGSSLTSVGTLANLTVTNPIAGSITGNADNVSGIVAIANGGTNSTAAATAGGIGYGTGTAHAYTAVGTTGQVLSSNGAGVPTWLTPSSISIPYTGAASAVDLGAYDLKVYGLTIGRGSGSNITFNTAFGRYALENNTTGEGNTATGAQALQNNTTGQYNNANGHQTLRHNTLGSNNTANGALALQWNTTGANNIAAGYAALKSNTEGYSNAAFGGEALTSNTTGFYNTALGKDALRTNIAGLENTGVGLSSLYSNNGGSYNTAIGSSSLDENTSGVYNTAMGRQALSSTTTGSNNAAVGAAALNTNTTGSNNTAIGYAADVATAALSNATAIGAGAIVSTINTIQLGNTSVTNVNTSGTITAGTVTYPNSHGSTNQLLSTTGSGTLAWTTAPMGLPTLNNTAGDMLYWNGTAWVKVAAGTSLPGNQAQNLVFCNGVPTWGTCPAVVPSAPGIGTATAGNAEAIVAFTAPSNNGGAAITSYTVTSSPGGITATGTSSPIIITALTSGTPYTFTVTATNSAGTGAASVASTSVTPLYFIGQAALGGKIAYILQSGDPGYDANTQHGLIAATSDQSSGIRWYNGAYTNTLATATAIGTGLSNTNTIITSQGATSTSYAAGLARAYTVGGYTDWYLPSKDELNKLSINRVAIGGFASNNYWSSTEINSAFVEVYYFGNGNSGTDQKDRTYAVRAIRAF